MIGIIAIFLLLGLIYDTTLPLFEGPDELWHYAYVQHLAEGGDLPLLVPGEESPWMHEGSQAPLYYYIIAAATSWIDTSDYWSHRLLLTPNFYPGSAAAEGERTYFYHTRTEDFPYRTTTLAVHLGRWITLLMGAGVIALAYATGRELLPLQNRRIAQLTAAMIAFTPVFIFLSAQITNDTLANLIGAAITYMLAQIWMRGFSLRRSVIVAVLAGVMALTKVNGLIFLPLIAIIGTMVAYKTREWKQYLIFGATSVIAVIGMAGWWYARNVRLYGDPLAIDVQFAFAGGRNLTIWQALTEYQSMHKTHWGVFGVGNILLPDWMYIVYAVFTVLAIIGVAHCLIRLPREKLVWFPPLALITTTFLIAVYYYTSKAQGPQARLAFPAMSAMYVLAAVGLLRPLPVKWRIYVASAIAAGMLGLAVLPPFTVMRDAYDTVWIRPPLASEGINAQHELEATLGDMLALHGYDIEQTDDALEVTLHFEVLNRTQERNLIVFTTLLDENGTHNIAQSDSAPINGTYPAYVWSPGEYLRDTHVIALPDDLSDGEYIVQIGVYRLEDVTRLIALDADGKQYLNDVIWIPITIER